MNEHPIDRRDFVKTSLAGAAALGLGGALTRAARQDPAAATAGPATVFRSDMAQCLPPTALTRDFAAGRWQLIDYETTEGVRGTMVYARPDEECPVLTLPLNASGWHRIHLGIHYTNGPFHAWSSSGQLDVRLSGNAGFCRVAAEANSRDEDGRARFPEGQDLFKSIQETYWGTADLTGKSLEFRQPQAPYRNPGESNFANLAYVKLVPLSVDERRAALAAAPTSATRRLAMIYAPAHLSGSTDGTATFHPTSEQWFADEFQPCVDTDVGVFVFEAMRGNYCLYRTAIGDVGSPDNRWRDEWVDPLAAFTRQVQAHDVRILAALRMIGPQYPMIRAPIGAARHYWRNRQWTKRDREGRPVSNLSLAYPGVRQYWLSLLREALAYGIDGIQLHLNRSTPFVLYEEPVVRDFQEKYGEDPRRLPGDDDRWLAHCAGYLTQFVREVRALLDEKPGRQLGVTVFGPTREHPGDARFKLKSYACDVDAWLRERLVDYVMPSQYIDLDVLAKWRALAGDRAHLWPDLMPRFQPAASYAKLADKYYQAGADGFCLWDGNVRPPHLSEWAAVRRLGHRDQLDAIRTEASAWYRTVPLVTLGDFSAKDSFRDG